MQSHKNQRTPAEGQVPMWAELMYQLPPIRPRDLWVFLCFHRNSHIQTDPDGLNSAIMALAK